MITIKDQPARKDNIDKIMEFREYGMKYTTDDLIRNFIQDGQPIIVDAARRGIQEYKEVLQWIKIEAIEYLPERFLNDLHRDLHQIDFQIKEINRYEVRTNQNLDTQKQSLGFFFDYSRTDGVLEYLLRVWEVVHLSLSLFNSDSVYSQKIVSEATEAFARVREMREEMQRILDAAKDEITKKGVSKHAGIFETQANSHKKKAKGWRDASIALILFNALFIIGVFLGVFLLKPDDKITIGISTLLLVSLVSYCVVQTVKNYLAEKHNEAINQHKANCLSSFMTFTEGAPDDVKSMVLQYTTQTIFSNFNPGFLSKEPVQSPSPVLEILRTIGPKAP